MLKQLALPQLAVVVTALAALASGIATIMPQPAEATRYVIHTPATPHVMSVATHAPVNCSKVACFALTFDDGPDATITPQILDILDRQNVRATFFVLGGHVKGNEAVLRRIHKSGHEIGNHSWSHPPFTQISLEQVDAEVQNTQAVITSAGVPMPRLFRPPYGDFNDAVLARIPLTVIRWNVDPEDWRPKKIPHVLEHMAAFAKPGGMVVLHDTESTTAATLDQLINQLKSQNYTMVTVSELLDLPAGQQGVFYGR
jgi:peptidoglycan/xylan/chitin deacetylase (PgdA/CDA1 family)